MKRIFELGYADIMSMPKESLLEAIVASEGRTVMAEVVVSVPPLVYGASNAEVAAAFGADMVTLNGFDFEAPAIAGLDLSPERISEAKGLIGRFLGVNLEPVPWDSAYAPGRRLTKQNLLRAAECGFDYVVITGNPGTGVTADTVLGGIAVAKEAVGDRMAIVAGKMHGSGNANVYDPEVVRGYAGAGANIVLIPAPGTVPMMDQYLAAEQISAVHGEGALAMTAMGTSQEGAGVGVIEQIALMSKMAGADVQHIGDAGFSGMAPPENIMALSVAIRGRRHTYRRMAYSMRR